MSVVEAVTPPAFAHAEGPVWIDGLHFVDMMAGDVVVLSPEGTIRRWHVDTVAAVVRPRTGGGLIVVGEREFLLADGFGGSTRSLGVVFTDPGLRFNEGGCDPSGRLLVGTMAYDETPGRGTVYRLDGAGGVTVTWDQVTVSNGLGWNATGDRAYYADTPTGRIDVFDSDAAGNLTGRRPFVTVDRGSPDGLTVDAGGGVWVALWGGSAVRRYDVSGALTDEIEMPAPNVTACTVGPDGLLYITTSKKGTDTVRYPQAGSVFVADVGAAGLPVRPFAG